MEVRCSVFDWNYGGVLCSMRTLSVIVLLYLGGIGGYGHDPCCAQTPQKRKHLEERFPFNSDGDGIYVPIQIGEKLVLAAIDTGSTLTVLDSSLRHLLGHRAKRISTSTSHGDVSVDMYEIAGVMIGRFAPPVKMAAVTDLGSVREVAGHDVMGIIGMDILAGFVIHLDSDKGIVALSVESASIGDERSLGKRVGVEFKHGVPFIPVQIPVHSADLSPLNARVLIDTGWSGLASGRLEAELFAKLSESGGIADLSNGLAETLAGKKASRKGTLLELRVGNYHVAGPCMSEGGPNLIGMGLLSRFNVTLDFPNAVAIFSKSRRFDDGPDKTDLSGLHLWRRNGSVRVHSVDKESLGEAAGIRPGDIILRIGSKDAATERLHTLRLALCAGGSVNLIVKRSETAIRATLNLARQNKTAR